MKIAFIAPTELIEDFHGDFHLALSHLVGGSYYKNAYVRTILATHKPIILDNGLFENGKPEPTSSLFKKAKMLGATTVFCPDTLFNRKKTEATFKKIAASHDGSVLLAFVVQADNVKDYIESYQWAVEQPQISLIGLSILSIPHSFKEATGTEDITTNRLRCLKMLNELPRKKASHLLGAGSSYQDVDYAAKNCPWVVSHDSSSAVWNAIQNRAIDPITLDVVGGKTPVPVDFNWKGELSTQQLRLIQANMRVVKKIVHKTKEFTRDELKGIKI